MKNNKNIRTKRAALLVGLFLPLFSSAQQGVVPGVLEHEDSMRPALTIEVKVPKDEAKEAFETFMDERHQVNVKGLGFLQNKDLLSMEAVRMPQLDTNLIDLYASFEALNDQASRVTLIGREGDGLYYSKAHAPEVFERFAPFLREYRLFALETYYRNLLEEQQEQRKDLLKDQEKDRDRIADDRKEIEENLEDNKDLRKDIKDLEQEMADRDARLKELQEEIVRSKAEIPFAD